MVSCHSRSIPIREEMITPPKVAEKGGRVAAIIKMEIRPASSGRERFGSGTKTWAKYPLETPALSRFSR